MSDHFQLRIVTPRRLLLDEQVREVTAPGTVGEFGVLADHATFLSSLEIGLLTYRTDRERVTLAVRGGFAEVDANVMTVLAEAAQLPAEIDPSTAEQDRQAAVERLSHLSPIEGEYARADADRLWAETRLDAAQKK